MPFRYPSKASLLCACKVVCGSAAVLVSFLSGYQLCPPNILCVINPGVAMRVELFTLSVSLLAAGLLLSALRDLLLVLGTLELLDRDIEAVADPINENLILHFGLNDT